MQINIYKKTENKTVFSASRRGAAKRKVKRMFFLKENKLKDELDEKHIGYRAAKDREQRIASPTVQKCHDENGDQLRQSIRIGEGAHFL